MSKIEERVHKNIKGLMFFTYKTVELISMFLEADKEFSKMSDEEKISSFNSLGYDLVYESNMSSKGIHNNLDMYSSILETNRETVVLVCEGLEMYISEGKLLSNELKNISINPKLFSIHQRLLLEAKKSILRRNNALAY